jgi:predicted amidohydrolase
MKTLAIAAVQLEAHDRDDFARAWPNAIARIEEAARMADLVVAPEGSFPAYVLGPQPLDASACATAIDDLKRIAREHDTVIVCGGVRIEGAAAYNSAFVVDTGGTIAGHADKCFLWHFDRRWFAPGERIAPIATSVGTLGVLVCADGRMPGIARELVSAGAQILVMPTAWVTSGRDSALLENIQADLLARVRAWENAVPFVAANKCGVERSCVAYCGKSQIIDAFGNVIAIASQGDPEILRAEVSLPQQRPRSARPADPIAASVRPEACVRVAITARADDSSVREAMALVEAECIVAADGHDLDRAIPTLRVSDATVIDPLGLVAARQRGYRAAIWDVGRCAEAWIESLARARALELKMYVIAIDAQRARAFAVDPDGGVVAGTFGKYRVASFVLDSRRAQQTAVAPGTDVAEGLERVDALTREVAPR